MASRVTRYHLMVMPQDDSSKSKSKNSDKTKSGKPPVYLLDSMAFIFRAYHAMQRSRPMSTRTGIPTAATYVFVNMINKLRKDFAPEYLAAVYDVGAPVHRNEMAAQMKDVKKFSSSLIFGGRWRPFGFRLCTTRGLRRMT
jgi:hypothetical protein